MELTTTQTTQTFSFAALFDPAVARAAAARGAQWNLPRQTCRPLDRYVGPRVTSALAAFDAEIELSPLVEEEVDEDEVTSSFSEPAENDTDFEDSDDEL